MSNRVTLAQLAEMPHEQASVLPVEQIAMLLEDVAAEKTRVASLDDKLHKVLHGRFGEIAQQARRAVQKDTGTVRLTDGDGEFIIVADAPKKVEWDQAGLRAAAKELEGMGEDVAEYVTTKLSVPEKSYEAWPKSLKAIFEPARTVGVGKPTYKIERKKEAA